MPHHLPEKSAADARVNRVRPTNLGELPRRYWIAAEASRPRIWLNGKDSARGDCQTSNGVPERVRKRSCCRCGLTRAVAVELLGP